MCLKFDSKRLHIVPETFSSRKWKDVEIMYAVLKTKFATKPGLIMNWVIAEIFGKSALS